MARTYTETVTLQEETCASCGVLFAMPQHLVDSKRKTGTNFYCPNGHTLTFGRGTDDVLREELQAEKERYTRLHLQLSSTVDQLDASRKELQRHKKRTANGVCPCCNRTFSQLQRHMNRQHPDYATKDGV